MYYVLLSSQNSNVKEHTNIVTGLDQIFFEDMCHQVHCQESIYTVQVCPLTREYKIMKNKSNFHFQKCQHPLTRDSLLMCLWECIIQSLTGRYKGGLKSVTP